MEPPTDLAAALLHLPDSLRSNPFDEGPGLEGLTDAQMEQLLSGTPLSVAEGWGWENEATTHPETHIRLRRTGGDDGLSYDFLELEQVAGSIWVLVLHSHDDHCCRYNRWAVLEVDASGVVDRSAGSLPAVNWGDFFSSAAVAQSTAPSLTALDLPLRMQVKAETRDVELEIIADYLDLGLSEDQGAPLRAELPVAPRRLRWERQAYRWGPRSE